MLTQTDLDQIDKAIASGVLTVKFADRLKTYRSIDELLKARQVVSEEIATANNVPIRRQIRIVTNSGW